MPEAAAAEIPKVIEKVFHILKRELSAEEHFDPKEVNFDDPAARLKMAFA